jgi:hypothetical protein
MRNIFLLVAVITVFGSCRKYPDFDELSYKPVVVTNYDATADFGSYLHYYMSTELTSIADDPADSIADPSIAGPILNAIAANLESRGYVRVAAPALADIGINAAVIKITTTVQTYPPSYWWGYPGYGGCYYGYCGYYPYYDYGYGGYYSYSYSYTTGSLIVQVADLKNVDNVNHKINILWTNFDSGVLGSTAQNTSGAVSAVNQAFIQSPYFKNPN